MAFYNYLCKGCMLKLETQLGREPTEIEIQDECVFETRHSMFPDDDEVKERTQCPTCNGLDTEKMLSIEDITTFVRGVDWDTYKRKPANQAAMRRDMALHQLRTDDPYGYMRKPGDTEDLADRIEAGSRRKPKRQHFLTPKSGDPPSTPSTS